MSDDAGIVWEEPPEEVLLRAQGGGQYVEAALALRARPGEWGLLPTAGRVQSESSAKGMAQSIRRGKTKGFAVPASSGSYEAVADGVKVWARFMPKADDDEEGAREPIRSLAPRVRAWAKEKGMEVPDRGRLPESVMDAFFADTGEQRPARLVSVTR